MGKAIRLSDFASFNRCDQSYNDHFIGADRELDVARSIMNEQYEGSIPGIKDGTIYERACYISQVEEEACREEQL